jgi:hypothetical protein
MDVQMAPQSCLDNNLVEWCTLAHMGQHHGCGTALLNISSAAKAVH